MKGRTALVTGGGRGIGAAIARRLAREGAQVWVVSRTLSEIQGVAAECGASCERCDVTVASQVDRLARKIGPVDILVNNAGHAEGAPFVKTSFALWRRILDANLTSAFLVTRAFVPGMIRRNYGRIVNIASLAGKRAVPYITAYCAAKHALLGFNASLALELSGKGIRVNAVCPGYVDTPMTRQNVGKISKVTGRPESEVMRLLLASLGQPRLLKADHVAELAAALARQDCPHTGAAIDL